MALVDSTAFAEWRGVTLTGDDLVSATALAASVDAAIKRMLRPFHPEPVTLSNVVLDAPFDRDLFLPVTPARSITSVYYRSDANGLVSAFSSDYLIDNTDGDAYQLEIDDHINGYSRKGVLRRVNRVWGWRYYSPPERLGWKLEAERGAILVNYLAGPTSAPADIRGAALVAMAQLYDRRVRGAPLTSESWNGRSESVAGQFTADAAIRSPEVLAMLAPYLTIHVG